MWKQKIETMATTTVDKIVFCYQLDIRYFFTFAMNYLVKTWAKGFKPETDNLSTRAGPTQNWEQLVLHSTSQSHFFLPTCRNSLVYTQVVSPQETPGYNATFVIIDFDCVAAEWVMYVYLCLLLVFIPCYFWSHSIPGRLNMEQESDASLIALTTHFAQVNETKKKKRSTFASNITSFPNSSSLIVSCCAYT